MVNLVYSWKIRFLIWLHSVFCLILICCCDNPATIRWVHRQHWQCSGECWGRWWPPSYAGPILDVLVPQCCWLSHLVHVRRVHHYSSHYLVSLSNTWLQQWHHYTKRGIQGKCPCSPCWWNYILFSSFPLFVIGPVLSVCMLCYHLTTLKCLVKCHFCFGTG